MAKKFTIFILLIVIQSCNSDGYRVDRDFRLSKKINIKSDNAILIAKVDTKSINHEGKVFDRNFNRMDWCRNEKMERCKDILYFNPYSKVKFKSDFDYDFYSIKSGYYYLDQVKQLKGYLEDWYLLPITIPVGILTFGNTFRSTANFSTSPSGWNKKLNAPNFASFEANSNEIVYIGDLYFTFIKQKYWIGGKINLEVKDNYNEAVNYFRAKYPEYKDRLVIKRLAQSGVLLDNYNAGIFW